MKHTILNGDCQDVLKTLPANSIDAVLTDPPYGLNMAGWDHSVPPKAMWEEVLRVLKPGGHMLAFGGTRTFHRLTCAIEDAGFEIRDVIMWVHGEGFPKGSNLKPSWEPIIVCRKKGKGKLNIDQSRVPCSEADVANLKYKYAAECGTGFKKNGYIGGETPHSRLDPPENVDRGRHPANLIHDGSEQVLDLFPQTSATFRGHYEGKGGCFGGGRVDENNAYTDEGSAARYFYCAKPSPGERETANGHPTIKPLKLMRYLVKLISYEGELVLDPFMGSGSSIIAARLESRNAIGIDLDQAYCDTAVERCEAAMSGTLIDVFE